MSFTFIVSIALFFIFIAVVFWNAIFPSESIFKGYGYKNWESNQKGMTKEQARQKYKKMSRISGFIFLMLWVIAAIILFCKSVN